MILRKFTALRHLLLPVLLALATSWAQAQTVRTVEGRRYVVHTVEQGQTLYAISRTYAVSVEDLLRANPGAEAGLGVGQELLVPQDAVNKKEARTAPALAADGELVHTVAKKETLFGISRNYNVEVNALLERNPELNSGLREGMTVVIPVRHVGGQIEAATRPASAERILEHIVQPGETLFALGKRYAITPEAIQAANDGLPEGLKAGMTVRIPLRIGVEPPPPTRADSLLKHHRYRIGFMLPFSLGRNDSVLAATSNDPRFYEPSRIAAQFYAGARMALDSMEKLGLRADVTVLDQGDEPRIWNSVLRGGDVKDMDLFIGPFHRTAIEQLARTNSRAHIVCPVPQTNKLLLGNPTVSKVSPTRSDLIRHTGRYVAQRHSRENIVLLMPDHAADKDAQDQLHRALQEALAAQPTRYRDSVQVFGRGRRDVGDITSRLDAGRLNVIVSASENVEYVTALVGKLKPLAAKYRILLVGMETWLTMSTVAATDLDLLGYQFAAGSFIDREDPRVLDFLQRFRQRYSTEADEYAFQGFDVTFYYLKALLTQGMDLHEHFSEVRTEPLHLGFRMVRAGPENGFRNEYAVMLQQKDLRLQKAP
jgi:LysM repeat protein